MAPKRPADSYTAPSVASSSKVSTGKRVKFAAGGDDERGVTKGATEDDAAGLEDDLEGTSGGKRQVVMTEGYDSDSSAGSDDGFGVGGGRKGATGQSGQSSNTTTGGAAVVDDDDDDDMFGGGQGGAGVNAEDSKGKGKVKDKEFLEMGDIEGQEFGKGDDGEEDGEEDDLDEEEEDYDLVDDLANDDDAPRSRRSKKGMGYNLSSFNMQDELSEGRFSADGTYVRNAEDPLANHDTWLDGLSKKAIKAARESKQKMDEAAKRRAEEEAKGDEAVAQERDDCMIGLLSLIREGETVTKALNRLGASRKKVVRKKVKAKTDGDTMEVDDDNAVDNSQATTSSDDPIVKKIDKITLLASTLLAQGELEIYDTGYEDIIKTLRMEGAVRRDWVPPRDPDIEKEAAAATRATEARAAQSSNSRRSLIARPTGGSAPPIATEPKVSFFYKWTVPQEGQPAGQEYGPYSGNDLQTWISGGYFGGPEAEKIAVRVEGQNEWKSWKTASSGL